jgi:hypothetical protein
MDSKYLYLFDGENLTQLTAKDAPKSLSKARTSTRQVKASEKALLAAGEEPPPAAAAVASTSALPPRAASRREKKAAPIVAAPIVPVVKPVEPLPAPPAEVKPSPSPAPSATPVKASTPVPPVKIVIGAPPSDWTPPTYTDEPKNELHRLIRQENPIVFHNGTITLSPVVFKSMKPQELESFAKMEKDTLLKLLQQYMVEHVSLLLV